MNKRKGKNERGITLIALIVTVIIMAILAGAVTYFKIGAMNDFMMYTSGMLLSCYG